MNETDKNQNDYILKKVVMPVFIIKYFFLQMKNLKKKTVQMLHCLQNGRRIDNQNGVHIFSNKITCFYQNQTVVYTFLTEEACSSLFTFNQL